MTLVMFQSVCFLQIFVCNASNARAYRPSYRCQQLGRNYIKYNYILLRQPVLYLPIHAITGGQLLLYNNIQTTDYEAVPDEVQSSRSEAERRRMG